MDPAAGRALAKIRRVLPHALRRRVAALASVSSTTAHHQAAVTPAGVLLELADAIGRRRQIICRYVRHDGAADRRQLSPLGLVAHADRWYLAAYDRGRGALRTFRVDRLSGPRLGGPATTPPEGFDAAAHVRAALADAPWRWLVRADLELPYADAATRLGGTLATLTAIDGTRTALRLRAEHLDYAARVLAGLGCRLVVYEPDALRVELRALAARLGEAARPAQ